MPHEAALPALVDTPAIEPVSNSSVSQSVPLSAVCEVRVSNVDKKSEPGELPVRLCNYTDVYKNDYITDDLEFMRATASRAEIARFGLRIGDVIITKDSETPDDIGIPSLVDSASADLVCGYHLAMIRSLSDKVNPAFLAKQLAQPRLARYFGQQANGSTRYGLSISSIERAPIWLPSTERQQEVNEIARQLDAAVANSIAIISKLRQILVGSTRDLLRVGIDENGKIRDLEAQKDQFADTPIGKLPKAWRVIALSDLCSHIGSGVTPRGGEDVYTSSGILFIRSQNVAFDGLNLEDVAYVPTRIHQGMLRSEVHAHDVLYNITGASIGRCCAMPAGLGTANVNQHVCILRVPNATDSDASFLSSVLASSIGQIQLYALNTNGNRQGLNYQQLGSFVVPWPSAVERQFIARELRDLSSQIESEIAGLKKLQAIRTGLLSDLLNAPSRNIGYSGTRGSV
jgi:type I restriction enzyme, S subunit